MLKKELCFGGIRKPDFSYGLQQKLSMDFTVRSASYTASDGTKYVGANNDPILDGENAVKTGTLLDKDGNEFPSDTYTRPFNFYTANGNLILDFLLYSSRDQSHNNKTVAADLWITAPSLFLNRHLVCLPKSTGGAGEAGKLTFTIYTGRANYPGALERDILNKKIYVSTFYSEKIDNTTYNRIVSSDFWDGSPKINRTNDVPNFVFTTSKLSGSYTTLPDIYKNALPRIELESGVDYPVHVDIAYGIV